MYYIHGKVNLGYKFQTPTSKNVHFVYTYIFTRYGCFNIFEFSEPRKVLPILKTDEPVCPEGKLSCGNGECVDKELFCNGKPDCKDESDENACSKFVGN